MGVWVEGVEGHGRVPLQGRAARQAGREVGAAALGSPRHPAVLLRAGVVGNGAMGRGGFRSLVGGGGEGLVDWVSGCGGGGRSGGRRDATNKGNGALARPTPLEQCLYIPGIPRNGGSANKAVAHRGHANVSRRTAGELISHWDSACRGTGPL